MPSINNLLNMIGKDHLIEQYKSRNRLIKPELYIKLKKLRKCMKCGLIVKIPLYIHHITAIKDGGTNDDFNLLTLCYSCHEELDVPQPKDDVIPLSEEVQHNNLPKARCYKHGLVPCTSNRGRKYCSICGRRIKGIVKFK